MNLYFRLIRIMLQSWFTKKSLHFTDPVITTFRAWPFDCDINFHLTNARYLALADLSRIWLIAKAGMLKTVMKKKWLPVLLGCEVTFIKPIKPWQKFQVSSQVIAFDEKYIYIEHRFEKGDKLFATILIKTLFMVKGKKIPTLAILKEIGVEDEAHMTHNVIDHWKILTKVKKGVTIQ